MKLDGALAMARDPQVSYSVQNRSSRYKDRLGRGASFTKLGVASMQVSNHSWVVR